MGIGGINLDNVKLDLNQLIGQIGGLGREIRTLITGKEIEDPNLKAQAEQKAQEIDYLISEAQNKINAIEAASASVFVAGGRPFIIWVIGIAMACYYIPQAVLASVIWFIACYKAGWQLLPFPLSFNLAELLQLGGMLLGLGAYRTFEKVKGVQDRH
jgi:hypothetical protein